MSLAPSRRAVLPHRKDRILFFFVARRDAACDGGMQHIANLAENGYEVFTFSSLLVPPAPAADESRGCISRTVLKRFSEVVVRKPISALGWSP